MAPYAQNIRLIQSEKTVRLREKRKKEPVRPCLWWRDSIGQVTRQFLGIRIGLWYKTGMSGLPYCAVGDDEEKKWINLCKWAAQFITDVKIRNKPVGSIWQFLSGHVYIGFASLIQNFQKQFRIFQTSFRLWKAGNSDFSIFNPEFFQYFTITFNTNFSHWIGCSWYSLNWEFLKFIWEILNLTYKNHIRKYRHSMGIRAF